MQKKTGWIAAGAVVLATVGGASGIAVATGNGTGGNDDGVAISGQAYDRATAVALQTVGSGKVTQTEQGDEESYYQVEVTKPDGTQVDVNLDRSFNVVKTKAEAGETNDDGAGKADDHADGETNDDGPSGAAQR